VIRKNGAKFVALKMDSEGETAEFWRDVLFKIAQILARRWNFWHAKTNVTKTLKMLKR